MPVIVIHSLVKEDYDLNLLKERVNNVFFKEF